MNRYAAALLLIVAGLVACGSADDPANVVEKPAPVAPSKE